MSLSDGVVLISEVIMALTSSQQGRSPRLGFTINYTQTGAFLFVREEFELSSTERQPRLRMEYFKNRFVPVVLLSRKANKLASWEITAS